MPLSSLVRRRATSDSSESKSDAACRNVDQDSSESGGDSDSAQADKDSSESGGDSDSTQADQDSSESGGDSGSSESRNADSVNAVDDSSSNAGSSSSGSKNAVGAGTSVGETTDRRRQEGRLSGKPQTKKAEGASVAASIVEASDTEPAVQAEIIEAPIVETEGEHRARHNWKSNRTCARCIFMRNRSEWKALCSVTHPDTGETVSWLMETSEGVAWAVGCAMCRGAKISNKFGRFRICKIAMMQGTLMERHAQQKQHRIAQDAWLRKNGLGVTLPSDCAKADNEQRGAIRTE